MHVLYWSGKNTSSQIPPVFSIFKVEDVLLLRKILTELQTVLWMLHNKVTARATVSGFPVWQTLRSARQSSLLLHDAQVAVPVTAGKQ